MFEETNEGTKCWKGYEKKGMKTMFGKEYQTVLKKKVRKKKLDRLKKVSVSLIKKSQGKMLTKKDIFREQPKIAPANLRLNQGVNLKEVPL